MISVFNFKDYRAFIRARFKEMPKGGYGQSLKLAEALGVHTTLVSQVLKGDKSFTLEQASQACDFFGLSEMETDCLLLLVQLDRSGSASLKRNIQRQLEGIRSRAQDQAKRLPATGKLTEEQSAIFYSDWAYSALRQMTAIKGFSTIAAIADHFGLTHRRTREIFEFLLAARLCKEEKGVLKIGPSSTQIDSKSAWVRINHLNWRQKSIESLNREGHAKIHSTTPMTLSREDAEVIREMIIKFLESIDKVVDPSPSETLRCLNVDWFEVF